MFEVINRSEEAWGPLAKCDDKTFNKLITTYDAKTKIKDHIKKQKKLKTYKVTFNKEWRSDQFELQAENDWEIGAIAALYFKENQDKIGFKEQPRGKWAGEYKGYDTISYVKVRS